MNNSKLAVESLNSLAEEPVLPRLRAREAELVNLMSAMNKVLESEEWKFIEKNIFGTAHESAKRSLESESRAPELNASKIYRLQGELKNLERYDLKRLSDQYRSELIGVRNQLKIHG